MFRCFNVFHVAKLVSSWEINHQFTSDESRPWPGFCSGFAGGPASLDLRRGAVEAPVAALSQGRGAKLLGFLGEKTVRIQWLGKPLVAVLQQFFFSKFGDPKTQVSIRGLVLQLPAECPD